MISRTRYSKVIRLHLERRVAWDSVRGGLREDFNAVLARSTQAAGLAALVGPAIINNAIDSFVAPQGIASLLRIAKVPFQTQIEGHHPRLMTNNEAACLRASKICIFLERPSDF
jgi:hypothetical protein